MNEIERERKFLVRYLPAQYRNNLDDLKSIYIEQGYTSDGLRIRREILKNGEEKYSIIKKLLTTHASTKIENHPFGKADKNLFSTYWPKTVGRRIKKRRYYITLGDLELHLDIFISGINDGKMLVEVEFPQSYKVDSFSPPEWFGREVTTEITNSDLAEGVKIPNK
jgi:CYTH domain-containing protein